jgi:exonuclease SbcD
MTAGNHDSPGRMEAPAPFLALLDAYVVGQTGRTAEGIDFSRIVLPLKNRVGEVAAWCIALPFLRPGDVPRVDTAADAYLAGMQALYAQAYAYALALRQPGQAIIALGHCHITGGQVSLESERRIVIGGAEALSDKVFDAGIAYVALGHLHLAQKVGGSATRRYCGSPLPMSFSEVDYKHQVVLVELDGEAVASTRELLIPRSVELLRVPKMAAPLAEALAALQALALPDSLRDAPQEQWPYLQVRVQLSQPEPSLRLQVEQALADKPVRLVRIETSTLRDGSASANPQFSIDELSTLQPADYFERLYQHRFAAPVPDDLMAAFTELLNTPADAGARP